uniref:Uncharacterized protein n=1 Tax=Magallana gigas TaxID=29159 RepID=A0A8W8I0H9_MAGGI
MVKLKTKKFTCFTTFSRLLERTEQNKENCEYWRKTIQQQCEIIINNWGKIAFSSLKLKEVLKETVMKNHLCPNATDAEIHVYSIAKYWFRFASDWEGGRKKRTEKKFFPQHKTKPIGNRRPGSEPEDATQDKILDNMNFLMS